MISISLIYKSSNRKLFTTYFLHFVFAVLDCPSCRKEVHLNKERLEGLPRNLALENVVIRYTEERSK